MQYADSEGENVKYRQTWLRWLRPFIFTLAPLTIGISLSACAGQNDATTPEEPTQSRSSSSAAPTPSVSESLPDSYLDYVKKSAARKQIRELCPALEALVSEAEGRLDRADALLDGYSGNDPFEALTFTRKNQASDFRNRFGSLDDAITDAARKSLKQLSKKAAARTLMTQQYQDDALTECDLSNRLTQARTDYGTIASRWSSIEDVAASVPWYPRGFDEYEDGLAYRFVDGATSPCYSSCFYWTIEVTSLYGCSDGLYAELNISQGNRVVDWTNDTLPSLAAGQVAQLQMVTYSSSVNSNSRGELVTLRCYE